MSGVRACTLHLCEYLCIRTRTSVHSRPASSRALVADIHMRLMATGTARISFCATVCIDSAVHSPLCYVGCVSESEIFFHYLYFLRIPQNARLFGTRCLLVAHEISHSEYLNFAKGFLSAMLSWNI